MVLPRSFLNPKQSDNKIHPIGINSLNAASPVMVTRYFSRYIAQTTIRKYELRSASLSAIGVPTSPGISVIAAEAAVAAAVSSNAVVFLSSSD